MSFDLPLDLPSGRPSAAIVLCLLGLLIIVMSWDFYWTRKSAVVLHEFSMRHPGTLVPVDCGETRGEPGIDYVHAYGRFKRGLPGKNPLHVDACWYSLQRYAQLFATGHDVVRVANLQYERMKIERQDYGPAGNPYWPLIGIPFGALMAVIGLSMPFVRLRRPDTELERQPERRPVDTAALQADLQRLRQNLGR